MPKAVRPLALVPTQEVLDLTAELQALGSSNVCIGTGYAAAVVPGGSCSIVQGSAVEEFAEAMDAFQHLTQALVGWLQRGLHATALLLGLPAQPLLEAVVASVLQGLPGSKLGISWQAVTSEAQTDALLRRPSSRLGKQLGAHARPSQQQQQQRQVVGINSAAQAAQVLAWAEQEQQSSQAPAHLVISLHLRHTASDAAAAHAADALLRLVDLHVGPTRQQEQALQLLQELASLHKHRLTGDHLLSTARLSPLNTLLAPLLGMRTRLFVAADLSLDTAGGSRGGPESRAQVLELLKAVPHIKTVCSKQPGSTEPQRQQEEEDAWVAYSDFGARLLEAERAVQQGQAEAAARAAADAARREHQLRPQSGAAAPPQAGSIEAAAGQGSEQEPAMCKLPEVQQLKPSAQQQQHQKEHLDQLEQRYRAQKYSSPMKAAQQVLRQQEQATPAAHPAHEAEAAALAREVEAAACTLPACAELASTAQNSPSIAQLQQQQPLLADCLSNLRQQFKTLYAEAVGEGRATSLQQQHQPSACRPALDTTLLGIDVALSVEVARIQQGLRPEQTRLLQDFKAAGTESEQQQQWMAEASEGGLASSRHLGSELEQELAELQAQAAGMCTASPAVPRESGGCTSASSSLLSPQQLQQQPEASQPHDGALAAAESSLPSSISLSPQPLISDAFDTPNLLRSAGDLGPEQRRPKERHSGVQQSVSSRPQTHSTASTSQPARSRSRSHASTAAGPSSTGGSYAEQQELQRQRGSGYASQQEPQRPPSASCASSSGQQSEPAVALPSTARALASPADGPDSQAAHAAYTSPVPADRADEAAAAAAAAALEQLQEEQRLNAELLRQLHDLQQQVHELAALAATIQQPPQPPIPGVQDPTNFDAMVAALQQERQQRQAREQQLALVQAAAGEEVAQLEVQLSTMQRQLALAKARCAAWERRTPLASAFQRCEEEVARLEAEAEELRGENQALARLLAESELHAISDAAGPLPNEAAATCRALHDKLRGAQAQARKLQEDKAALQRSLQALRRRDRLTDLARRQATDHMRKVEELQTQLAQHERQLEAQCLAAAEAAAWAAELEDSLAAAERQLGAAAVERMDLLDANESLRKQVALLRSQLSCDRVLQHVQLNAHRV